MNISLPVVLALNVKRLTTNAVLATFFFSLLFLLTSYFILHTSYFGAAHAQACDAPAQNSQEAINQLNKCAIEKDIFDDKIFNLNQISGTTDSLYNLITGRSQLHPETNTVTQNWGALASVSNMTIALYKTPPASGVQYLAGEFQKFNPVQPAYAQGIGFSALTPVQKIWTAFRNLSYVGFVIVFVIIGFMIMLRAHISPQTVATIQDSIPRLVVALILVTFSYAIAGLFIDVMFLALNIVVNFLQSFPAGDPILRPGGGDVVFKESVFTVIINSWGNIVGETAEAIEGMLKAVLNIGDALEDFIGFFVGGIAGLIVGIAMLFIMFRVFLMLLMAYVMIIILTMVAPFFFLVQALPGNNGAKEWFKQMAANVAVFPTVALMFIFAGIIGGISALGGTGESVFSNQEIGQFPLLVGNINAVIVGKFIGIGLLLMTPEAGNMVKRFISGGQGGGGGFGAGAAIGGAIGAGAGVVGAGARQGINSAWNMGPIGNYRQLRQSRMAESRQRQVELESVDAKRRKDTFFKK